MREILFRAKTKNGSKWVYGDLLSPQHNENCYSIFEKGGGCVKVKPNTIGQYIGIKDLNGLKVFEDDIILFADEYGYPTYEVFNNVGVVEYCGNAFFVSERYKVDMEDLIDYTEKTINGKVIGNIYDNPELAGGVKIGGVNGN